MGAVTGSDSRDTESIRFVRKRYRDEDGSDRQLKGSKREVLNTTSYVQILGNGMDTQDTSPSVLLFFENQRFIFNAGEGFQRYCIEHKIKLSKINPVFLSRVCSETAGGLPGLLLTLAGIGDGRKVNIWGPPADLDRLVAAMECFVPKSAINILPCFDQKPESSGDTMSTSCKFDDPRVLINDGVVKLSAIVLQPNRLGTCSNETLPANLSVIYICELSEIKGKFDAEKSASLGLHPGPKRGQLQRGKSVDSDTQNIKVHPSDVIGPSIPGPIVVLIDCPTPLHLQLLLSVQSLARYYSDTPGNVPESSKNVDCVIHLSPTNVTNTTDYQMWMSKFGSAQHIMVGHEMNNIEVPILEASARMGTRLNYLCPQLFPASGVWPLQHLKCLPSVLKASDEELASRICETIPAENLLKFHLRPHASLGLDKSCIPKLTSPLEIIDELRSQNPNIVDEPQEVNQLCDSALPMCLQDVGRDDMEIVFLGTGSSQPSKHRNVSSIFINLFSRGSLLLDCGEGTLGQLRRRFGIEDADKAVKCLQCIWISHIHADHHMGLARILVLRSNLLKGIPHDPLIVIGPVQLKGYLDAYQIVEDLDMQFLDCEHTKDDLVEALSSNSAVLPILNSLKKVLVEAGIETLTSVPVEHCEPAYGVVLKAADRINKVGKTIPGWKLVYSGDTRPRDELIKAADGATVLIHEATFEDDLWEEAEKKKHSTIKEALGVGDKSGVYRLILTHFSQRYPKIPNSDGTTFLLTKASIAFDYMTVNLADLPILPRLMPDLKLLFPDEIAD